MDLTLDVEATIKALKGFSTAAVSAAEENLRAYVASVEAVVAQRDTYRKIVQAQAEELARQEAELALFTAARPRVNLTVEAFDDVRAVVHETLQGFFSQPEEALDPEVKPGEPMTPEEFEQEYLVRDYYEETGEYWVACRECGYEATVASEIAADVVAYEHAESHVEGEAHD